MSDSSRSHELQPTRLLRPGDSLGRILEWLPCPCPRNIHNSGNKCAALALKALEVLKENDPNLKLDPNVNIQALNSTVIPFRMERICNDPLFFLDGAHNPDAAKRLKETITQMFPDHKLIFIMGMFKDKDYNEAVRIMAPMASDIFTVETPYSERALPADELRSCIINTPGGPDDDHVISASIDDAVNRSIETAQKYNLNGNKACIIAFGSLSYLKYVKKHLGMI